MARDIVVIGGGVIGTAVAWRLALREAGDIALLERDRLGSGTTWHSAGNVTWMPGEDRILALFDDLERVAAESGRDTGWLRTGRLFLAREERTLEHFRAMARSADAMGFRNALLEPGEAAKRHPWLDGGRLAGAWFNAESGRANPADLTAAYAEAARRRGVSIREGWAVEGFDVRGGRVVGVRTNRGPLAADVAVVCCGLWSRRLLAALDVPAAQWGCQHFYVIARGAPRLERTTPSFVCPDDPIYGREEVGDMLFGCFDEDALALDDPHGAPPDDFSFSLLAENWDKFAPYAERAAELFPPLARAGIRRFVNGPESFTPDGEPLVGACGDVGGLYVASGMNSGGVTLSSLAGHVVADLVTETPEPTFDPAPYDPARFGDRARDGAWLARRAGAVVGGHYRERFEA